MQAFESVALRLAIDMKLIDVAVAASGPIDAKDLAAGSKSDLNLTSMP